MRVDALRFVVLLVEGTPLSLEVEHKEVEVQLARRLLALVLGFGGGERRGYDLVDKPHFYVFDGVRKAAELTVLALACLVWVEVAELRLVFLAVVQTFDPVVGSLASLSFRTSVGLGEFAKFGRVKAVVAPLVLERVEKVARFVVVGDAAARAFEALEVFQQQVSDKDFFARPVVFFEGLLEDHCLLLLNHSLLMLVVVDGQKGVELLESGVIVRHFHRQNIVSCVHHIAACPMG